MLSHLLWEKYGFAYSNRQKDRKPSIEKTILSEIGVLLANPLIGDHYKFIEKTLLSDKDCTGKT